jgi:hypothetical protein
MAKLMRVRDKSVLSRFISSWVVFFSGNQQVLMLLSVVRAVFVPF